MKKLSEKFRTWYHHASLASKIRLSYFILLIPVMFFVLYCIYNIIVLHFKHFVNY